MFDHFQFLLENEEVVSDVISLNPPDQSHVLAEGLQAAYESAGRQSSLVGILIRTEAKTNPGVFPSSFAFQALHSCRIVVLPSRPFP